MSIKIISVIVCDDIRKEISNKDILIGVYSGSIVFQAFPSTIPLSLWIEVEPDQLGPADIELRIVAPSGNPETIAKLHMEVGAIETTGLSLQGIPLQFEREGDLKIAFRQAGEDWRTIKTKKVIRTPSQGD